MAAPKSMVLVTKEELIALIKSANAKEPSGVEKFVLWTTKWSPNQLKNITDAIGTVQSIVAVFGTFGAAVSTAKALLEMIGILEAEDPFADLRRQVDALKKDLREGLKKIEDKEKVDKRTAWAFAMSQAAVALSNFRNAPGSQDYQKGVKDAFALVQKALFEMLNKQYIEDFNTELPVAADIAFFQKGYGYPPANYTDPPNHWVPYASSPMMTRSVADPAQRSINFFQFNREADPEDRYNEQDLKARIWDPSYYLDLVPTGIAYYLSLLAAMEPAYRATAHNRLDLVTLAKLLKDFVDTWRNSLLVTNVGNFLPPNAYQDKTSFFHPYGNPYLPAKTLGIPLGVVDPVSGLMFFNPVWNEGFVFDENYLVTNTTAAAAIAQQAITSALVAIENSCGIATLRGVQTKLEALAEYGLYGSAFSRPERVKKLAPDNSGQRALLAPMIQFAPETIELGEIGVRAGKPGKQYRAHRFYDPNGKCFRLPMVRRMFTSGIQLGYHLVFTVDGSALPHRVPLTAFNSPGHPGHNDNPLPQAPEGFNLVSEDATVYDVVQTAHYSEEDEERFERGEFRIDKQRLFLNPRSGRIALHVDIDFELDLDDPSVPYIAFANVRILNIDPSPNDAFIVHVAAFETADTSFRSYASTELIEEVKEISASDITIHFVPTYLVAEPTYFEDRFAGLAVIDKSILEVMQAPDVDSMPWLRGGGNPKWRNRDLAMETTLTMHTFKRLAIQNPKLMAAVVARFQPPLIVQRKP